MAGLEQTEDGVRFAGSVDSDRDVEDAALLASACAAFRPDDEDEDPLGGAVNCFGCRFRRWVPERVHLHEGAAAGGRTGGDVRRPGQSASPVASQSR